MSELPPPETDDTVPAKRGQFFPDAAVDRLLEITVAVISELAVTRQRLDAVERLLVRRSVFERQEVDGFRADPAEHAERHEWQQDFLRRTLASVQREIDMQAGRP